MSLRVYGPYAAPTCERCGEQPAHPVYAQGRLCENCYELFLPPSPPGTQCAARTLREMNQQGGGRQLVDGQLVLLLPKNYPQ